MQTTWLQCRGGRLWYFSMYVHYEENRKKRGMVLLIQYFSYCFCAHYYLQFLQSQGELHLHCRCDVFNIVKHAFFSQWQKYGKNQNTLTIKSFLGRGKPYHSFAISSAWTSKWFHLWGSLIFLQGGFLYYRTWQCYSWHTGCWMQHSSEILNRTW